MGRVEGKVVLVTGAAGGIGGETVRALVAEGAAVVGADLQGADVVLDVTQEDSWQAAVAATEAAHGPISGMVNCAGVASYAPLESLELAEFRRVCDINQVGTFLGMKSVIGSMKAAGGGSIVNISSLSGLVGMPMAAAYTASKWAVRGMTKSAAVELGPSGIRVNSVHPGVIDTPMAAAQKELIDQIIPQLPLGRLGEPEEVANLNLFLISDEASYSTGCEFTLDGGWSVP